MERRTFVGSVARLTAGFAGLRWSELAAVSARASGIEATAAYQVLTPEQVRLLDVVTAHFVPTDDTPGGRVSVTKYDVAIRMTSAAAAR